MPSIHQLCQSQTLVSCRQRLQGVHNRSCCGGHVLPFHLHLALAVVTLATAHSWGFCKVSAGFGGVECTVQAAFDIRLLNARGIRCHLTTLGRQASTQAAHWSCCSGSLCRLLAVLFPYTVRTLLSRLSVCVMTAVMLPPFVSLVLGWCRVDHSCMHIQTQRSQ